MTTHRFSRELQALDSSMLPSDPQAQGRFSPVGACMTLIDTVFPWALALFLPYLLLQRVYCEQLSYNNKDPQCSDHLQSSLLMCDHTYCVGWILGYLLLEALFHVAMRIKLAYLQSKDPLVESFMAKDIASLDERQKLWDRTMKACSNNPTKFFEDWFYGANSIESLTDHDLENFIAWGYFDGRCLEHLSESELQQLDGFVKQAKEKKSKKEVRVKVLCRQGSTGSTGSITSTTDDELSLSGDDDSHTACTEPSYDDKAANGSGMLELQHGLLNRALNATGKKIPDSQLVQIMRRVTQCHADANAKANVAEEMPRSKRFMRHGADPLLGIYIAPLFVHVLVALTTGLATTIGLWVLGFSRHRVNDQMTYYYRPGSGNPDAATPQVFIHGIGVGPVIYLRLIYQMICQNDTQAAIFLPEIPTVSAFRPWLMPSACLSPPQVAMSLSQMLADHGFAKATVSGHSFGTFWMSYMVKYAPNAVAGLVFLDPACFCLYNSVLSQRTVYSQHDRGDVSYLIKTDMMVNWSIQRNFSWAEGNLFVEDIPDDIPVVVFLSGADKVAPSDAQEEYLREHRDCKVEDFIVTADHDKKKGLPGWKTQDLSVMVFRGYDHGGWLLNPFETTPLIVDAMASLAKRSME